ncbi:MAG: YdeI/OmpD-associated family protein [Thermoplasmata archaeon]|nr:YdeI/OmpD-associated family protein [Thermoplasmata archaeon]MCI4328138.1 YdeI/OmpD-associated family protein [Thermoplasmata archaeon]MCI4332237.1 YdeI/OmpD-associated family protein [Thermoplasmata archaeon]
MRTSFTSKLKRPDVVGAWTFAPVPKNAAKRAGFRARLRVKGTIDGVPFRSSLIPRGGGELFVVVNSEVRDRIGKSDGAPVRLELELDARPVVVDVPPSLRRALDREPSAAANFANFTASQRLAYSRWVADAKQDATRDRRVAAALEKIGRGKKLN